MKNHKELNFSVQTGTKTRVGANELHVDAFLMYEARLPDSSGVMFEATPEFMHNISSKYKSQIKQPHPALRAVKKILGAEANPMPNYAPVIKDHAKGKVDSTVGHVLDLEAKDFEGKTYLFAKLSIKGETNIKNVEDDLWKNLSISFDYDDMTKDVQLLEVSYVYDPAFAGAMSFSAHNMVTSDSSLGGELRQLNFQKKQYELELSKLKDKRSACRKLKNLVNDGFLTVADFKRLLIDFDQIESNRFDPIVRCIKTVAMSKFTKGTRISSDFSNAIMDSFVDRVSEIQGATMSKTVEENKDYFKNFAKGVVKAISSKKEIVLTNPEVTPSSDFKACDTKEEPSNFIKFSHEDMQRMSDMAKSGKTSDLMAFMDDSMSKAGFACSKEDKADDEEDDKKEDKKDFSSEKLSELDHKIFEMSKKLDTISTDISSKVDNMGTAFDKLAHEFQSIVSQGKES